MKRGKEGRWAKEGEFECRVGWHFKKDRGTSISSI